MSELVNRTAAVSVPRRGVSLVDRVARSIILDKLELLETGRLQVIEGNRVLIFGDPGADPEHQGEIRVHDPAFFTSIGLGGSIGAGEAYAEGTWSSPDLTAVIRILARNPQLGDDLEKGLARLAAPARKFFHRVHTNSRQGARRNIGSHYDLGNDFFARFLDDTMTYSCGYFLDRQATLEEASVEKYDRICRKLDLRPSHEVLEIGCGWGGFAIHAAREYGCRVVATTISENQYDWAVKRVRDEGLGDRVEIVRLDYRDLPERLGRRFDLLVSIEMIEAVGRGYLGTYFETCNRLLAPGGLMALQAITIADQRYREYGRSVDFIQRYIFPGGFLPSVTAMSEAVTRSTDMRVVDLEDIGKHYARTLRLWHENFLRNVESIRGLGYPEEFLRLWEFYFCYCEGAFLERAISDVQIVLAGPDWRGSTRAREL